jgi:hypothetical protein
MLKDKGMRDFEDLTTEDLILMNICICAEIESRLKKERKKAISKFSVGNRVYFTLENGKKC